MLSHARWFFFRLMAFYLFFTFEITIVEASTRMFVDQPKGCSENAKLLSHCAIASGDQPYAFFGKGSRWEISKGTVVMGRPDAHWKMAQGEFVLKSTDRNIIETPFGEIHVQQSDVFVELGSDQVSVSVLGGSPVLFYPRSGDEPLILVAGFKNWYGGIGPKGQTYGTPTVVVLKDFAQKRAHFFTDQKLGFVNELKNLAVTIKRATVLAAKMHEDLVAGRRGQLENQYQEGVQRKGRQIQFDQKLRRLFRKKMRYDD